MDRALAADRPALVDVRCDLNVPPVPRQATLDQINGAASALVHGDEDRWEIVRQGVKTKLQEFLPYREGWSRSTSSTECTADHVLRAWSVVMRAVLAAFSTHPWAWNEIGFGGLAYPRRYMRLGGPRSGVAGVLKPFERRGSDLLQREYANSMRLIQDLGRLFPHAACRNR